MRKEIEYIVTTLHSILNGEPWYGRPVMKILQEIDPSIVYKKPNENSHSLIELLYHMNTWAEFTLKRLGVVFDFLLRGSLPHSSQFSSFLQVLHSSSFASTEHTLQNQFESQLQYGVLEITSEGMLHN